MATVSFEISTAFLTRMRAVMVAENPALQGQTNAVINEAARVRVRDMVKAWVVGHESRASSIAAVQAVPIPGDVDIT